VTTELTEDEFRTLVTRYLQLIRSESVIVDDEYAVAVKLWNTIVWGRLESDELYGRYNEAFFPDTLRQASFALGATPTRGMSLRSEARGLNLGGTPEPESCYLIVDRPER
jgi:hypothetical protein